MDLDWPTLGRVVTQHFPPTPAQHVVSMLVFRSPTSRATESFSPHMTLMTRLFSQDGVVWARHLACAALHDHRSDDGGNTVFIERDLVL